MKKEETLRGPRAFTDLMTGGDSLDGELMRCWFRTGSGEGPPLVAGFAVSSRRYSAVRRNRLRRLMRAAFDGEHDGLVTALNASGKNLAMVFLFKGRRGLDERRLGLEPVRRDLAALCRSVAARL